MEPESPPSEKQTPASPPLALAPRRAIGSPGRAETLVFAACLALGALGQWAVGARPIEGDEKDFMALASGFAATGELGWPGSRAFRAPLYPGTLGALFALTGPSVAVARALGTVLGAGVVALAFRLARVRGAGSLGWVVAGALVVDSYWWQQQVLVGQENLLALLLLLTASALVGPRGAAAPGELSAVAPGPGRALAAGALFGLSQLAKPTLLPAFGLALLVPVFAARGERRAVGRTAGLFVAGGLLVLAPWCARNARLFGVPVLTTGSGRVFSGAHSRETFETQPGGWLGFVEPPTEEEESALAALDPDARELAEDRWHWARGRRELTRRSTVEILRLEGAKVARFLSPSTCFDAPSAALKVAKGLLVAVNALALGGALFLLLRARDGPALALLGGGVATVLVFWGSIRFRYPLAPVLYALAAGHAASRRRARAAGVRP